MSEEKQCATCVYSEPMKIEDNFVCHFYGVFCENKDAEKCKKHLEKVKI